MEQGRKIGIIKAKNARYIEHVRYVPLTFSCNYNIYIICQLCIGTGRSTADSRGEASRVQALFVTAPPSIYLCE